MTKFVIDASAVAPLILSDEANRFSRQEIELISAANLIAPAHWPFETANMLIVARRRQRLDENEERKAILVIHDLEVEIDFHSAQRIWTNTLALASATALTVYDAAYLELALREGCSLLTLDKPLSRAAQAHGVQVPLIP